MYIFGFGSLININSAQKSFRRKLQRRDFIPVILKGYEKIWNSIEYIEFEDEEKVYEGIFLNLQKQPSSTTNGVVLKITPEEFEFLKKREKNYSFIKLDGKDIEGIDTNEEIYTFITKNEDRIAKKSNKFCVIPQKYINLLEEGLSSYNEDFKKEFVNSYSSCPFPIKDGKYRFSDPIQNKFAKDGIGDES
ncbi:hypothetical protein [Halarcobacter sp.]|uniref:hypothetical protein n=1 Tax=Halarcobacter sp. TaxID=2321133 RepID=UPI002AABE81D|nr:hypothetical protein [Halarcobacter sp.]